MSKLFLDSDACIKLCKIGFLHKVCETFECAITREVYSEAVLAGLQNSRPEAQELKKMVDENKISLVEAKGEQFPNEKIGLGEASVLDACLLYGGIALSDDRRFLSLLLRKGVAFHTPASLIVAMKRGNLLKKEAAIDALEKLSRFSNPEMIQRAFNEIGGE